MLGERPPRAAVVNAPESPTTPGRQSFRAPLRPFSGPCSGPFSPTLSHRTVLLDLVWAKRLRGGGRSAAPRPAPAFLGGGGGQSLVHEGLRSPKEDGWTLSGVEAFLQMEMD